MKKSIVTIVFLFLIIPCVIYGADKADKNIDFGPAINNPLIHQAVFAVLKAKGVSCEGLETKDGYIRIIKASADVTIAPSEIQAAIDKITSEQDIEKMIQDEVRVIAIQSLKDKGKLDKNYIDKKK